MPKWVYSFGGGGAEGDGTMTDLLGGKGAGLAEMSALGLPVPPGFTITTGVSDAYRDAGAFPSDLTAEVDGALARLEAAAGAKLGDPGGPLIVAVRSGAPASMPGMMDTVLNLGLNDDTAEGLGRQVGDPGFAFDCYRRFISQYGDLVLGIDLQLFEDALEAVRGGPGPPGGEVGADEFRAAARTFQSVIASQPGADFPQDPGAQLWGAIEAVVNSWNRGRAVTYRKMHDLPDRPGTAVTVQAMVFGNRGGASATGVGFTRDPATGHKQPFGEYLPNAQGEDVVSGLRTPRPLARGAGRGLDEAGNSLEEVMPDAFRAVIKAFETLESHFQRMQEVEFTLEEGRLWILQTRAATASTRGAIRIAVDMAREGIIGQGEALRRIEVRSLARILHPEVDADAPKVVLAQGIAASPGAASGPATFSAEDAEALRRGGPPPILVRPETRPEDIHGIGASAAVVTSRGGATSHAAVVARAMGRPCVTGAGALLVDPENKSFSSAAGIVRAGDVITVDGTNGMVCAGAVPLRQPELGATIDEFLGWADDARRTAVYAAVETPDELARALNFGADGVTVGRIEHLAAVLTAAADRGGAEEPVVRMALPAERGADFGQAVTRAREAMGEVPSLAGALFRIGFVIDEDRAELLAEAAAASIDFVCIELGGSWEKEEARRRVQRWIEAGRQLGQDIGLGVCGDAAANPDLIGPGSGVVLDHVSVPVALVPVARLAAAQAA